MAARNEPGGGVVPSAWAAFRTASRSDQIGLVIYCISVLLVGIAIVAIVLIA